jgi:hypothetical protein
MSHREAIPALSVSKWVRMTCQAMHGRKYVSYTGMLQTIWPIIVLWKKEEETELVLRQWELRIPNSPFQGFNHRTMSKQHDLWEVKSDDQYTIFMCKVALPQNTLFHCTKMPPTALSLCCHITTNTLYIVHLHYFQSTQSFSM